MTLKSLLNMILHNEQFTRGLEDAEARMLVEWLVEHIEADFARKPCARSMQAEVRRLCRRARVIARFVALWCHEGLSGPALQLAATERFTCPLPVSAMEACDLMNEILLWETQDQLKSEPSAEE